MEETFFVLPERELWIKLCEILDVDSEVVERAEINVEDIIFV